MIKKCSVDYKIQCNIVTLTSARYEGGCVKYLCDCHNFLDYLRK